MDFSVLMSVYAKESPLFLKEALESLRNQTLPAAEIVIVKDGPIGELSAVKDGRVRKKPRIGLCAGVRFAAVPVRLGCPYGFG